MVITKPPSENCVPPYSGTYKNIYVYIFIYIYLSLSLSLFLFLLFNEEEEEKYREREILNNHKVVPT